MNLCSIAVIPHVGMWIETSVALKTDNGISVIPHVGMWIETPVVVTLAINFKVIPHVGMWIETENLPVCKSGT